MAACWRRGKQRSRLQLLFMQVLAYMLGLAGREHGLSSRCSSQGMRVASMWVATDSMQQAQEMQLLELSKDIHHAKSSLT